MTVIDIENDPMFLLYDVARLIRVRADQRARQRGMTRAQWVILAWLEQRPGMSQNELAGLVEVEPITIARLVDRLEGRGLVERRHDPSDRRVRRLHLTGKAGPELEEIHAYRADVNGRVSALLGPEALAALTGALGAIKNELSEETAGAAASG